jgi:hypothetical protein
VQTTHFQSLLTFLIIYIIVRIYVYDWPDDLIHIWPKMKQDSDDMKRSAAVGFLNRSYRLVCKLINLFTGKLWGGSCIGCAHWIIRYESIRYDDDSDSDDDDDSYLLYRSE